MDVMAKLRISVYDLDCGAAGATAEKDAWMLARVMERAGYRAGRPVED